VTGSRRRNALKRFLHVGAAIQPLEIFGQRQQGAGAVAGVKDRPAMPTP